MYYNESELMKLLDVYEIEVFKIGESVELDIELEGGIEKFNQLIKSTNKVAYLYYAYDSFQKIPNFNEFPHYCNLEHMDMFDKIDISHKEEMQSQIDEINQEIEQFDFSQAEYFQIFINDYGVLIGIEEFNPNFCENFTDKEAKLLRDLATHLEDLYEEDMYRIPNLKDNSFYKERLERKENKEKALLLIREELMIDDKWKKEKKIVREEYARKIVEKYNSKDKENRMDKLSRRDIERIMETILSEEKLSNT